MEVQICWRSTAPGAGRAVNLNLATEEKHTLFGLAIPRGLAMSNGQIICICVTTPKGYTTSNGVTAKGVVDGLM